MADPRPLWQQPAPRYSIQTRIECANRAANALERVCRDQVARRLMTEAEATFLFQQMGDVISTLRWMQVNEASIKALISMDPELREQLLADPQAFLAKIGGAHVQA